MHRGFTTVDYEATLAQQVRLDECLPADHLARFIAKVLGPLDFAAIAARYGARGGRAYAPERLFGRLVYGSAIGVFSARKIARATYESAPFRLLAGTLHPVTTRSRRSAAPSWRAQGAVRAGAAVGAGSRPWTRERATRGTYTSLVPLSAYFGAGTVRVGRSQATRERGESVQRASAGSLWRPVISAAGGYFGSRDRP